MLAMNVKTSYCESDCCSGSGFGTAIAQSQKLARTNDHRVAADQHYRQDRYLSAADTPAV